MRCRHGKSAGLGERDDRLIIRFGRAESFGKLFRRQKVPVVGTGRIIDLLEKVLELGRVPHRQPHGQI